MRHFAHHIGDYAAHTSHLTFVEDAAYHRLLRRYYQGEKPLPADENEIMRLVRAASRHEKNAVSRILREFFTLESDGWHQSRADQVINDYKAQANRGRTNGIKGGRPKSVPEITATINHKPETNRESAQALPRTGSRLSADWMPSMEDRAFAEKHGKNPDTIAPSFRDYWHGVAGAKGRKADWSATWRNWIRREADAAPTKNGYHKPADVAHTTVDRDGDSQWRARVNGWKPGKMWMTNDWGPPPGQPGCRVPEPILESWRAGA